MKYAKDTRPKGVANKAAEVLDVEALPWIKNITGKTVVIKYGGSAMVDEQLRADVMNDIVLLKIVGVNPSSCMAAARPSPRPWISCSFPWSSRTVSASPRPRPWTSCAPC